MSTITAKPRAKASVVKNIFFMAKGYVYKSKQRPTLYSQYNITFSVSRRNDKIHFGFIK